MLALTAVLAVQTLVGVGFAILLAANGAYVAFAALAILVLLVSTLGVGALRTRSSSWLYLHVAGVLIALAMTIVYMLVLLRIVEPSSTYSPLLYGTALARDYQKLADPNVASLPGSATVVGVVSMGGVSQTSQTFLIVAVSLGAAYSWLLLCLIATVCILPISQSRISGGSSSLESAVAGVYPVRDPNVSHKVPVQQLPARAPRASLYKRLTQSWGRQPAQEDPSHPGDTSMLPASEPLGPAPDGEPAEAQEAPPEGYGAWFAGVYNRTRDWVAGPAEPRPNSHLLADANATAGAPPPPVLAAAPAAAGPLYTAQVANPASNLATTQPVGQLGSDAFWGANQQRQQRPPPLKQFHRPPTPALAASNPYDDIRSATSIRNHPSMLTSYGDDGPLSRTLRAEQDRVEREAAFRELPPLVLTKAQLAALDANAPLGNSAAGARMPHNAVTVKSTGSSHRSSLLGAYGGHGRAAERAPRPPTPVAIVDHEPETAGFGAGLAQWFNASPRPADQPAAVADSGAAIDLVSPSVLPAFPQSTSQRRRKKPSELVTCASGVMLKCSDCLQLIPISEAADHTCVPFDEITPPPVPGPAATRGKVATPLGSRDTLIDTERRPSRPDHDIPAVPKIPDYYFSSEYC